MAILFKDILFDLLDIISLFLPLKLPSVDTNQFFVTVFRYMIIVTIFPVSYPQIFSSTIFNPRLFYLNHLFFPPLMSQLHNNEAKASSYFSKPYSKIKSDILEMFYIMCWKQKIVVFWSPYGAGDLCVVWNTSEPCVAGSTSESCVAGNTGEQQRLQA